MTNDKDQYKYPCGLVRDLIPLYRDNVCGEDSRKIVEDHIAGCSDCAGLLEQLSDPGIDDIEEKLSAETTAVLENHHKKEHRTAVTAGLITAGILIIPVIVCLIINLTSGNGLGWFYIVLASLVVAASVTVVPLTASEYKLPKTIISFTVSVICLLAVCCIYTDGRWFFIAAVSVILGISLFCMPFVIRELPLPKKLENHKTPIVVLWDVLWLFLLLWLCCRSGGGDWFPIAAIAVTLGFSIILMPFLIKEIPLPEALKNHKALVVMIWDTVWLYILIFNCVKYTGDISFGSYIHNSIWIAAVCLLVPWTIFILIRYTKLHALTKAGLCILIPSVFSITAENIIMFIYIEPVYYSSILDRIIAVLFYHSRADLGIKVILMVFSSLIFAGIFFIIAGVIIKAINKNEKK